MGFLVTSFVVSRIGIAHFGIYGLITAVLAPLGLANLGFGDAALKYISQLMNEGNAGKAKQYFQTTMFMNSCVGVGGGLCILLFAPALVRFFFNIPPEDREVTDQCIYLVAITWSATTFSSIFVSIPPALQNYRRLAQTSLVLVIITSALKVAFVACGYGLLGFTFAGALGALMTLCLWFAQVRKLAPALVGMPKLYKDIWISSWRFGGWRTLGQIAGILANQMDKYILGAFLIPASVGICTVCQTLETSAYMGVFKLSEVLFPTFSAMNSESMERKLQMVIRANSILTLVAVVVLVPLIPISYDLLKLWVGQEIASKGEIVLQTMTIAGTLGCATNGIYFFLLGLGRTKSLTALSWITSVVGLLVAAFALPKYGLPAAGWSGVAGAMAQIVALIFLLKRLSENQLTVSSIFASFYVMPLTGIAISVICARLGFHVNSWPYLVLAYVLLASIIFLGCMSVNMLFSSGRMQNSQLFRFAKDYISVNVNWASKYVRNFRHLEL